MTNTMGQRLLGMLGDASAGSTFQQDLMGILSIIFMVVGGLMLPLAIFLAFKFTTASDEEKRRAIKTRFINVVATFFIIAILIGVMVGGSFMQGWRPGLSNDEANLTNPGGNPYLPPGQGGNGSGNGSGSGNIVTGGNFPNWSGPQLGGTDAPHIINTQHTANVVIPVPVPAGSTSIRGMVSRGFLMSHRALDLQPFGGAGASYGAPVFAIADGIMVKPGSYPGGAGGTAIFIRHNLPGVGTFYSYYAHLRAGSRRFNWGQSVTAGATIGNIGTTGTVQSTGHLHFSIRRTASGTGVMPTGGGWWNPSWTSVATPAMQEHALNIDTASGLSINSVIFDQVTNMPISRIIFDRNKEIFSDVFLCCDDLECETFNGMLDVFLREEDLYETQEDNECPCGCRGD